MGSLGVLPFPVRCCTEKEIKMFIDQPMFVVIDHTPLYDNFSLVSGPYAEKGEAIKFALRLADWYEDNTGEKPVRIITDDTTLKGVYTNEYLITISDNAEEFSRIIVTPVHNPGHYCLGEDE